MNTRLNALMLCGSVMFGCAGPGGGAGTGKSALTGIEWRLLSVTIGSETVEATGAEPNVASITFTDDADGSGRNRFSGGGGCNRIFGGYTATAESLEIGSVGATRMACPEPEMRLEQAFTSGLSKARSYAMDGAELVIRFDGGSMRLRREG